MTRYSLILIAFCLSACTSAVQLQNPATGQRVQCGPYADTLSTAQRESQCISDYQRQGFQRVPN